MVPIQNWATFNTNMVPASQSFDFQIKTHPNTQCQTLHNKKLPDWSSQIQLNKYLLGNEREEWFQAKKYSW